MGNRWPSYLSQRTAKRSCGRRGNVSQNCHARNWTGQTYRQPVRNRYKNKGGHQPLSGETNVRIRFLEKKHWRPGSLPGRQKVLSKSNRKHTSPGRWTLRNALTIERSKHQVAKQLRNGLASLKTAQEKICVG